MAEQPGTTPKQLYQVGWAAGQTDGEVSEQTVRQLLNVELDLPGELRPRRAVDGAGTSVSGAMREYKMSADPSDGDSPDGWRFVLKANGIEVYDDSGVLDTTLYFASNVSADTEVVVYGDILVVAAVDSNGDPVDTYIISYLGRDNMFDEPEHVGGFGYAMSTSTSNGWLMSTMQRVEPVLLQQSFEDTRQGSSGSWSSTSVDAIADACEAKLLSADSNSVLFVWTLDHENPDYGTVIEPTDMEYRVQFKYADGSTSDLSNPVFVSIPGEWIDGNQVAFTLAVKDTFTDSVAAINVYRKSVDDASQYELLLTANIYAEQLSDETSEVGVNAGWQDRSRVDGSSEADDGSPYGQYNNSSIMYVGLARKSCSVELKAVNGSFADPGDMTVTAGWRARSSVYYYFPQHYTFDGELKIKVEADSGEYLEYTYTASGLAPSQHGMRQSCRIVGGAKCSFPRATFSSGDYVFFQNTANDLYEIPYWFLRGLLSVDSLDDSSGYNGTSSVISSLTTFTSDTCPTDAKPLVLAIDRGSPGLLTYEDVEGLADEERATITARHIAVVNNRLLCLNVIWDDKDYRSRLVWSQHGKFRSFASTNYNEYGYKDNGEGLAIAKHGPRILVMHSSAVYAMDVSGGSDMAWRGIGSWNDLGLVSSRAFCETPFGVVFCDTKKVHFWDGQKMATISESQNSYMRNTYEEYVAGGITGVSYVPSMQQVWIASGTDVLVYDLMRGAWHEHFFDELTSYGDIIGVVSEDDNSEHVVLRGTGLYYAELVDDLADGLPFNIKVATGPITVGAPEIVKKLKRVYVETSTSGTGTFQVTANGDQPTRVESPGSKVNRISKSTRGYAINLVVEVPSEDLWSGTIKGIGMSFKPKRLK